jgi:5-methylcytosine-specific restriction protein A
MSRQQKFYNSKQWKSTRASYIIKQDSICEKCHRVCWAKSYEGYIRAKKQGKDVMFCVVHHRKHISPTNLDDPMTTLNHSNLQLLCIECHNKEHMTKDSEIREDITFDEMGNING